MHKISFLCGVILLASSAQSQEIDYDALFADRAADVETAKNGTESLITPGQVTLYRAVENGKVFTWGVDRSEYGAVGCAAHVVTSLRAVAEICPSLISGDQGALLKEVDLKLAEFRIANSYPPLSQDEQSRRIELYGAKGKDDFQKIVDDQFGACPKKLEADVVGLARNTAASLDDLLRTPRFSVKYPCF